MRIELTEEQRQAVRQGEAVRLLVPEIGEEIVLLRATDFEAIRAQLEDAGEQLAIRAYARKQARRLAQENPY